MEKERGVVEDVETGRRLAGLHCRDNRNGFETHDRGGRTEYSKGECVREDINDTSVCCSVSFLGVKLHRKKLSVFTLICLHTRRLNAYASSLGHQINTQSKRLE